MLLSCTHQMLCCCQPCLTRSVALQLKFLTTLSTFLEFKPHGYINYRKVNLLDKNNALDAGVYTFVLTNKDGSKRNVQARYSFAYTKSDGKWLIVNHHSSAMPEGKCP